MKKMKWLVLLLVFGGMLTLTNQADARHRNRSRSVTRTVVRGNGGHSSFNSFRGFGSLHCFSEEVEIREVRRFSY